jgi:hypothetical protein
MVNPNYFDELAKNTMVNKTAKGASLPLPRRLRALRRVLGYEQANQFALALGEKPAAYGMVEAGTGGLSTKMMIKISRLCPDVTWEWLQFGNERFLTVDMRQRLRSAEAELVADAKAGTKVKTTASRGRKPGGGPSSR